MWFSHTGIFTLLIELNAPVWAVTATAAMAFVPSIFLAPISGIIVDKIPPKRLLVIVMSIEAVSVLMLVFIDTLALLWLLLVIIFVRMGVGGVAFQVEMSLLPKLLSKKGVKLANEIHSIIWAVAYTLGMGLSGIFIYYFGVINAFLFDFALYCVGFVIMSRLNLRAFASKNTDKVWQMLREGLGYLRSHPLVAHLIALHAFVGVTSYDNLIALLANYEYKEILSASLVIGFMNMARAVSLIVGPIVLSRFINARTLPLVMLGQFAGIALWSVLQFNYWISFIGLFAAGFCISTIWSYTFTQLQNNCDSRFYGRVIAYNDMVYFIVAVGVSALIGLLFELGASLALITFGMGATFIVGALYYLYIRRNYGI